jgi:bifunctional DNA-binding transcriptional regulator/antitoxin component of YhaV-PrlF toxin-antitoxin module
LPKEFIDELEWKQGDQITFQLDKKNSQVILKKKETKPQSSISSVKEKIINNTSTNSNQSTIDSKPLKQKAPNSTPNPSQTPKDLNNLTPIPPLN